ncbi:MAG: hypothetical protein V4714_04470 [Bacteroidota bacterium]
MQPTQDKYPVFEANQVLTNAHLNQVFNYLDEQERLTRANLIGIGIVCGLEIRLDVASTTTIHVSKGCGITSEGYLIVEPKDVALVSYRAGYQVPNEIDYPPFKDKSTHPAVPYPLWELFPAGVPNTTALETPSNFLADKVVLLFLELKKEGLRNCSPNNCDDKGAEVQATVRRLLIKRDDLGKIIAEANKLEKGLTLADLETSLLARLNLPDLRLPRYDVPNTNPTTSKEVLAAFLAVFHTDKVAFQMNNALTAAYNAFKPVVKDKYPSNPFASFSANFSFLDNAPTTPTQVRFLPYYYDFFDDLIRAYDEFRWKGVELLCACCPPAELFPRHLMLGLLFPASVTNPSIYRHHFLASGAISGCEALEKELKQLFQRLVEMIAQFTNTPPLPQTDATKTDTQIRITPSKLADVPLSDKAIPYYYQQNGTPPLFQLWNTERTRRNRANQNLSYRSDEYTPTAPAFITNALRYDLEPYNFLRIEGHLGKNYQHVLSTLLSLKSRHRLPIEIIALRTGAFDEKMLVDISKEDCRFQDLETLYDVIREEWLHFLVKELAYLYNLPIPGIAIMSPPVKSQFELINRYAPDFLVQSNTIGRNFEEYITSLGGVVPDVNADALVNIINAFPASDNFVFYTFFYFIKLGETFPDDFTDFDFSAFEAQYKNLEKVVAALELKREQLIANLQGNLNILNWEEIDDRLEDILYACRLDAFKALRDEYIRRIREVKQKQFLSYFLKNNPGIQHKAGVPLGGTFILVYHDDPEPTFNPGLGFFGDIQNFATNPRVKNIAHTNVNTSAVMDAFNRISANRKLAIDPDIRFLLGTFTGQAPDLSIELPTGSEADKIMNAAIDELPDGTVIADFYLPYICCSDCSPVQFVLPKTPPTFTVNIGCSNPNNQAEVTVTPTGGTAPYSVKVGDQPYQPLKGVFLLNAGPHTLVIRDAEAAESAPQTVTIDQQLTLTNPAFDCFGGESSAYIAVFQINGGTPPYTATLGGTVNGNTFTTDPVASGAVFSVEVRDEKGCTAKAEGEHACEEPCDLPCGGQSRRCAYWLWVQPPSEGTRYQSYRQEDQNIRFRFNGHDISLPTTTALLNIPVAKLNSSYPDSVGGVIKKLNEAIERALVKDQGEAGRNRLVISYTPAETDPFGLFRIEHFVCDTFTIEFNYAFAKPDPVYRLAMRYTNEPDPSGALFDGAILINRELDNKETRVPAFDCEERNQCSGSDFQKLCEGPKPKPAIDIQRQENGFLFSGKVENMPDEEIVAWVWDASTALPTEPVYVGQEVEAQLLRPEGSVKLTAITKLGQTHDFANLV